VNAEVLLREHLHNDPSLPDAFLDVPERRPASFITVERVGGQVEQVRDLPLVAVQCWAPSRYTASELAQDVVESLAAFRLHPNVGRVDVNSVHNFPDLESRTARYQVVVELVTVG